MIEGLVNSAYEAVVTLPLLGPEGQIRELDAVIDTGFNSFLTLPTAIVDEFGLHVTGRGRAVLANGSEEFFDVCGATVLWDGRPIYVDTFVANAMPLIGMALLDKHNLNIEVERGGRVAIQSME